MSRDLRANERELLDTREMKSRHEFAFRAVEITLRLEESLGEEYRYRLGCLRVTSAARRTPRDRMICDEINSFSTFDISARSIA